MYYVSNLYQFERITWWCVSVLEFVLKFVMLEKNSWSLGISVRAFRWRWD